MGACDFINLAKGKSATEAFNNTVGEAQWGNGHGGYTGTIAEKHDFKIFATHGRSRKELIEAAQDYEELEKLGLDDKWGPAGCFELGNGEFLFFGTASS